MIMKIAFYIFVYSPIQRKSTFESMRTNKMIRRPLITIPCLKNMSLLRRACRQNSSIRGKELMFCSGGSDIILTGVYKVG